MFGLGGLGSLGTVPGNIAQLDPAITIFADGSQGFYYNFALQSSLFQDAAGTAPVTAAGQPIGLVKDQSGRGNNATSSATACPAWQSDGSGLFDGLDDVLRSTFNPTASITMGFKGVTSTDSTYWGATSSALRSYMGLFQAKLACSIGNNVNIGGGSGLLGQTITAFVTADAVSMNVWLNGTNVGSVPSSGSPVNSLPMFIGALNQAGSPATFMAGRGYKNLVIARALTPTEIANITTYWSAH